MAHVSDTSRVNFLHFPERRAPQCFGGGRAGVVAPRHASLMRRGRRTSYNEHVVRHRAQDGQCWKDTFIKTTTTALYSPVPGRLRRTRSSFFAREELLRLGTERGGCNPAVCLPPVARPLEVEVGAEGVERAVVPKLRERGLQALPVGGGAPSPFRTGGKAAARRVKRGAAR